MEYEVRIEARPWEPQDLIDDLQLMIDEEPDNYLNANRATLCMARGYLKKFFAEESLMQKWISVEDRMPEHGDVVLCHHKHTDYPIVCQWDERTGAWIDDKWSYGTGCITHWMPLPESPKED
jgi:hypothetical protein